jgi:hypothetical protein
VTTTENTVAAAAPAASQRTRPNAPAPATPTSITPVPGALRVAAIASLGAGAIHATAAGAHSEPRSAAVAFALTAVLQIGWGALALGRGGRLVGLAGVAVNGGALVGWVLAKSSGIGFVEGLEAKEAVQFADAVAAGLAAIAIAGALLALAGRVPWSTRLHPGLVGVAALATVALVVPGMVKTGGHTHGGGHGDEAAGHDHGGGEAASQQPGVPYTATLPVDLGGFPGVSAQDQAEAEELVTVSLQTLPRFADIPSIEAMGYRSIGDADTGYEHFMNWRLINDGRVLDPDYPESLVFVVDPATGDKQLGAAMYMANAEDTLETVPDLGGGLVQWHIHNDLCFSGETNAWRVAGDTAPPPEECRPGTFRLSQVLVPMVHVWIIPHECGPFAALEGTGAGQIAAGEERLCDHHHGAPA